MPTATDASNALWRNQVAGFAEAMDLVQRAYRKALLTAQGYGPEQGWGVQESAAFARDVQGWIDAAGKARTLHDDVVRAGGWEAELAEALEATGCERMKAFARCLKDRDYRTLAI